MQIGFTHGVTDERTYLLWLHRISIECETPMAKPKLKVGDEVRFQVFYRANYRCEKCDGGPDTFGWSVHHRVPRGMGGSRNEQLHLPANLILLCGSGVTGCHGWVESNRDKARERGFLLTKVESAEEIPFIDDKNKAWKIFNDGEKWEFDRSSGDPYL